MDVVRTEDGFQARAEITGTRLITPKELRDIETRVGVMPTKITARQARAKPPARPWPVAKSDWRMVSSLTKMPKGGEPAMARNPAIHKAAVTGRARERPRASWQDRVWYRARMLPETRKSAPLVREWATAWSMFSTLE